MSEHPNPLLTTPEDEGQPVAAAPDSAASLPASIGRYRVQRILGEGGFGLVYLAHDEQLQRFVAVKVPHPRLVSRPEDAAAYLTEARTVANLDHPNIVPVHDVGSTAQFPCFVVSKYIDGPDLATRLKQSRLSILETVDLVATVAEALHHAHRRGLVHRDIKPSNILLDQSGKPFVTDFGLALREQDVGKGPLYAGTPAYMSPEQARGEGHRVDGRSDLFSLGVVFYELLTGHRPFHALSRDELLEQIANRDVRPPRQWDDTIPRELERIGLKTLAKRAAERYTTAKDLADDLRHFQRVTGGGSVTATPASPIPHHLALATPTSPATHPTPPATLKIVPKGLRSFDAHDADFFLELLPGPRDREGLPDSIRFWKTRIEERDPDNTFAVGLIYGPSGCGKSSLVKAGLLPRLSGDVSAIYVEATALETETRLLNGLRKRCPALADNRGLKETLAALRRGQGLPAGKKLLIVLDQFEQWLHARKEETNTELVQALRQCDGGRVQCIVLVRDDFWMAATRFMRELEVRLLEGQNSAAVDLFDRDHARKVLAAFGRAFGKLPEHTGALSKEQKEFLTQAVAGLAPEGKIISVRLALFAEMMKGKTWTPAALKEVGGTEGVGVAFLEETFSAATAPPEHRYHQKAARAVLKALLPESGTDIKGHMRSYDELLQASGYRSRPKDFDELIGVLDSEIRLITPTDPEGKEEGEPEVMARSPDRAIGTDRRSPVAPEETFGRSAWHGQETVPQLCVPQLRVRYYQLTHDYLVHSLRAWLTRKQKETRRGRTELLLADRAVVWKGRPENRQLPSLLQWLQIKWLTAKKNWTPPQRQMMRRATRFHVVRGVAVVLLLGLLGLAGREGFGRVTAHQMRGRLLEATTSDTPAIINSLRSYRRWADPLLREAYAEAERDGNPRRQLHASLALLPVDPDQGQYLKDRLLHGEPEEILVIRQMLLAYQQNRNEEFWEVLEKPRNDPDQRFRAACALAAFDPDNRRWNIARDDVAGMLAAQKPFEIARWAEVLKPMRKALLPPLAALLEDEKRSSAERELIATIYGNYAADVPDAYVQLEQRLADVSAPNAPPEKKLERTKQQANTAVGLLVMNHGDKVWPLLKHSPDPTLRSYLIERLGPGGVEARTLLKRLDGEKDDSIRRAILLSLGEYGLDRLPLTERQKLLPHIVERYQIDPDPGIHGAARWLLTKWGEEEKIKEVDAASRVASAPGGKRGWSINSQGQTMVFIPKPPDGVFRMSEDHHKQPLGHDFAIASEDVTVEQFQRFRAAYQPDKQYAPTKECPAINVTWYDAAAYCNWLSEREGIAKAQWCYEPNKDGKYGEGMKIKDGYLRLWGYRLPTEVEWEYACRAGSTVGYSFGEPAELLERYGWFDRNSLGQTHPCGKLKPNDLGLFDMQGNVFQWTQGDYNKMPLEQAGDGGKLVSGDLSWVLRGGSWHADAGSCRAARRTGGTTAGRGNFIGFRLARVPVGAGDK